VAEWVDTQLLAALIQSELWTMFFDGSLMKTGAGASLLFISPLRKHLRYVLRLHFPMSNNVAEYEALVNGLRIAIELGVRRLDARDDSQLVIDQVMKNSHCRDPKMEAYCDEVRRLEDNFYGVEVNHVARRYNETADELAKIASARTMVPPNVFSRDLHQPSVKTNDTPEPEKVSALPEVPSDQPEAPSTPEGEALRIEEERNGVTPNRNWQTPYLQYLHQGELPLDRAEARRLAWRAKSFVLMGDEKTHWTSWKRLGTWPYYTRCGISSPYDATTPEGFGPETSRWVTWCFDYDKTPEGGTSSHLPRKGRSSSPRF
jgi:ribonuclease HI